MAESIDKKSILANQIGLLDLMLDSLGKMYIDESDQAKKDEVENLSFLCSDKKIMLMKELLKMISPLSQG